MLASLEYGTARVLHIADGVVRIDRVVYVETHVLRAVARHVGILKDSDSGIASRQADEDNVLAAKDLLEGERLTVEANGFVHVENRDYEGEGGDLGH
jgi:hypothetical protein